MLPMGSGVNSRAVQTAPILLFGKILAGVLHVNLGSPGSPAEQAVEGNNNDRCNRNQHPPVHADPSIEALLRLVTGALASSNFEAKTISKSGTIAESKIFSNPWIRPPWVSMSCTIHDKKECGLWRRKDKHQNLYSTPNSPRKDFGTITLLAAIKPAGWPKPATRGFAPKLLPKFARFVISKPWNSRFKVPRSPK